MTSKMWAASSLIFATLTSACAMSTVSGDSSPELNVCTGSPEGRDEGVLDASDSCALCGVCRLSNASAFCEESAFCVLEACNAGYADCNSDNTDGCETLLGRPDGDCPR